MSLRNKMKMLLSQADCDAIDDHLDAIDEILKDKLVSITPEDRARYGRINEKNKLLVNKVYDFNKNQPNLSSPDVDWEEFGSDYNARIYLETRASRFSNIAYKLESAKILHDNDNYEDALKDYAYSKYKHEVHESGYFVKVSEIKQFFNRTGTKSLNKKGNSEQE